MDLIGPYSKSMRQKQPDVAIIKNNGSLTCMTTIDLTTGWFKIVEIPTLNLDEVPANNDEYIDKSSAMVNEFYNKTWLYPYPRPEKSCLTMDLSLK